MPKISAASESSTFELHWDDQRSMVTVVTQAGDKRTTIATTIPAADLRLNHPDLFAALDSVAANVADPPGVDPLAIKVLQQFPGRADLALGYLAPTSAAMARWLIGSREVTNFTYDLKPRNARYLAHFLAGALGVDAAAITGYCDELAGAGEIQEHLASYARYAPISPLLDDVARFGRRIGWYAVVRAIKPRLVVETGVDQGLGSLVLCEALRRNRLEGSDGRYLGLDINPRAGAILSSPWTDVGRLRIGDAIESIGRLDTPVDLYVSDSDHSADYEYREYLAMAPHLSARAPIIADNAHVTDSLCRFAEETGRTFAFFREEPADHWYAGGGIGLSLPR